MYVTLSPKETSFEVERRAFSAGFDLKSAAGLAPPEDTAIDVTTGIDLNVQGPSGGTPGKKDGQSIPGGTGFAGLTERKGIKPVIAAVNGIASMIPE